ncbi:probable ATP-dependent RNA helicase DHX35 [Amphibalanus amphitrite]|uniref:probable ATP-dependent RNA helicase DHX35 n=1 Tax=Amphibalanus amphitrite TaxID=1232801 RepID=UPI001C914B14|nr:probable ATP-dependent RNA helicase DHX35 [Amphibalanus amphitrite]XP_043241835.1 probable ATP-dependent RNA helicase DHX35 [Amphibalanus amphitrite]
MAQPAKPRFWKPGTEAPGSSEDRSDADPLQSTTFIYNPHVSLGLQQQRQRLPVFGLRNHLLHALEEHQTLVLVGETGSGKSTQVPQYLHEAGWTDGGRLVGVTEPRRVAATTLAQRVADEVGCLLGHTVGYSIRFDERFDPTATRIKYMTEGILIREMMADPLLTNYSVIMLDEVHERTINTDIVMGLMKKILKKRRDLRLIVSSATVDAEELRRFFSLDGDRPSATILSVDGRQHPVEVYYSLEPVPNYIQACVDTVCRLHTTEPPGDVLVFLTGQDEVDEVVRKLREAPDTPRKDKLLPLPMYGALPNADQLRAFQRAPQGHRKVVVATNLAEASVTIPGIVYVVDSGFVKLRWYNSDTHTDSLVVCPTSRASAEQRAGRAGRVRSGKVYRLYPESEFTSLPEHTVPEVRRSDLAACLLQLRALGVSNPARFALPSPPPARAVLAACELLHALGALDMSGALTETGAAMAELPLPPTHARMVLAADEFGCGEEIATLVAMLQVDQVLQRPRAGQALLKARMAHRTFEVEEGDTITYLNIYRSFVKRKRSKQWCDELFVRYKAMQRVEEIRSQVLKMMKHAGFEPKSCDGDVDAVSRCITAGFFPNCAYLHHSGTYRTVRGDQPLAVHPSSVLYTVKQPQWVLFSEVVHTSQPFMKDLTVIDPAWLTELAPHFYQVGTVGDS